MGIEFSRSYKASDGKCYATLEEAQSVELQAAIPCNETVSELILEKKDAVLNILTLSDSSRPRARGKSKPRKLKEQQQLVGVP